MAKFFINRPIFAWVVAIFIMIAGLFSATRLPIEQYPSISAPTINISFAYLGASAQTIQDSVISIIEEQMNAIEGIDYMESKAYSNGHGAITITFHSGIDADLAQVNVQNKLSQVESRLPQSVRNMGIMISQASDNFLLLTALYAEDNARQDIGEISDYAAQVIKPELQRVSGVGEVQIFGSERAMRIWVDPQKLKSYNLSFADVQQAIASQNIQITAGTLGDTPNVLGQQYSASIHIQGLLGSVEEFEKIVIKYDFNGATVQLKDVAVVELGKQTYAFNTRLNGKPAIGIGVRLSSTGNAVAAAKEIRTKMESLSHYFPEGVSWDIPYDTSTFIKISLGKVLHTLAEAILLVFIVMYLFLQNIRYTIIPTIVVPISLLGALALMYPMGLSINVLTMFAMVLVIGIVVDDAIVVVENVERLIVTEQLTPYQAAQKSMQQITNAVIGITLVLISVFIPMAFLSGATGAIYRQFSLVMAASIGFSAFLALSLTPALCATILKPARHHANKTGFFAGFNRIIKTITRLYQETVGRLIRLSYAMMAVFFGLVLLSVFIFTRIPTSFLPVEDQGTVLTTYQLPAGATLERTKHMIEKAEDIVLNNKDLVKSMTTVIGFSFSGQGQNMAFSFISLNDWSQRRGKGQDSISFTRRLNGMLQSINEAFIFALTPPAIPSLGVSSGFSLYLQDRNNQGHEALLAARNQLIGMARQSKILTSVRPSGLEDATQLQIDIDRNAAFAQKVPLTSIAHTLGNALGSNYINDFPNKGRMQRVYVMAQANARMQPEDVLNLTVANLRGELVPISSLANVKWIKGSEQVTRYNGYTAMAVEGAAVPGHSTGEAMAEISRLAAQLPDGFAVEWTGQSLEEIRSGHSEYYIYAFSALAVFLCLAALYESWSIPFAVLLVVPLGIFGVTMGNFFRGYENDIYFKIGMITVMGLSAKNAILIIEFAKELQDDGMSKVRAAMSAAALRFRPIIMTSLAFIAGVVPLYFASGASSSSQRAIGTSVLWGMLIGTILSIFFVPIYYVVIRKIFSGKKRNTDAESSLTHQQG